MHDEATVHYIDMIDQTTLGHRFIKEEFGQIPRIGWQIDPFGHSAVQAYLLGAEVIHCIYFIMSCFQILCDFFFLWSTVTSVYISFA
jgi:alpha-mannosidase